MRERRLAFQPGLLDLAERFLGSADLRLYEAELWARYAGAVDYDQRHPPRLRQPQPRRPKRADPAAQMTSWILLSDVSEEDGPTKVVPLRVGESIPYWPDALDGSANEYVTNYLPAFAEEEISVTGPAGTLFAPGPTPQHHHCRRLAASSSAARCPSSARLGSWNGSRCGEESSGIPCHRSVHGRVFASTRRVWQRLVDEYGAQVAESTVPWLAPPTVDHLSADTP